MRLPILLLAAVWAIGCGDTPTDAAPPPATDAPRPTAQIDPPDATSDGLDGTWVHVATAATPDGPRDPLDEADISWTFRPDGTGTYSQQVDVLGPEPRTNDFSWTLQNETIELGAASYTIVSRDADEMIWRNDRLGDFYIVQRR